MTEIKQNGRYAAGTNRKLVKEALLKQLMKDPLKDVNKSQIVRDTGLSYSIVLKYVKEIQGGK